MLVDAPYDDWERYEAPLGELLGALLADDGLVVVETRREGRARASPRPRHEPPLRFRTHHGLLPMITAICPGSYDPVTNGHVDVIRRAAAIFDRVVVGVVRDPQHKQTLFPVEERVAFLEDALAECDNVVVDVFSELVVEFARKHDAKTMVKGLRVISDFEWEFQMNHLNRVLAPEIETVYVMASPQYSFVSSSGVKEIASFGGQGRRARAEGRRAAVHGALPGRAARRPRLTPGVAPSRPRSGRLQGSRYRATSARHAAAPRSPREYTFRPMDVLVLIDKLDDLVHNAKAVPLTDQVRLDREEIYEILDQMRATIPEEIKQARWIVKERQEMLAEAKREGDRIVQEAREQAVREASQTEIVKIAENQAEDIVDDARRKARETRLEMEDWADSILSTLEVNLDKFLTAVKRGRERLHERSQETVVAGIGPEPLEQPEEFERFA